MMLAVGLLLLLAQLWPCILSISPLQNVICVFEDNSKQNQLDLSYRHNCTSFPNNLSVAAQEVIDGTVLLFLNKEEMKSTKCGPSPHSEMVLLPAL